MLLLRSHRPDRGKQKCSHVWSASHCAPEVPEDAGVQVRFQDLNNGCDDFLKPTTLITGRSDSMLLMDFAVL